MRQLFQKIKKIDLILIIHQKERADFSFRYLTGIDSDLGIMYIDKKGRKEIFVSPLEYKMYKKVKPWNKETLAIIKKHKIIGINMQTITVALLKRLKKIHPKATFVDISSKLLEMRSQKSEKEIRSVKKAVQISESILTECINEFGKFKTEKEIAQFLKIKTILHNCELAFEPIVASGNNAKTPHHIPTKKPLQRGFCIIDFGVKYQGYCADMTRTIYLGTASKKDREIYKKIQNTLIEMEKYIVPSINGNKIMKKYAQINELPLKHALGHGVGIEVHEPPLISNTKDIIKENQIITLEPATYEKVGIRIENMYYVTKKGLQKINKMPIKLHEIKS